MSQEENSSSWTSTSASLSYALRQVDDYVAARRMSPTNRLIFQKDTTIDDAEDSFPYFSFNHDVAAVVSIPRGGETTNQKFVNARPDVLDRADDTRDEMLELMPEQCSLIDFHPYAKILEQRADFLRDLFQPESKHHHLIQQSLEPFILQFPFQKIFKLRLPVIGGYEARIAIDEAKIRDVIPSEVHIVPVSGFKQKLDVTIRFPKLSFEYDYDVEFQKLLFGVRVPPKVGKLRLNAKLRNPVIKMRLRVACIDCQGNALFRFRKYAGYAVHVGKGFFFRGFDGMKKASMIAIYDAEVDDIKLSFDSGDVNDIRITNLPSKGGQDIRELERQVPGLAENLKKAASFLYNGILKTDLQRGSAAGMKKDFQAELNAMRPHFFRSYLEKQQTKKSRRLRHRFFRVL